MNFVLLLPSWGPSENSRWTLPGIHQRMLDERQWPHSLSLGATRFPKKSNLAAPRRERCARRPRGRGGGIWPRSSPVCIDSAEGPWPTGLRLARAWNYSMVCSYFLESACPVPALADQGPVAGWLGWCSSLWILNDPVLSHHL